MREESVKIADVRHMRGIAQSCIHDHEGDCPSGTSASTAGHTGIAVSRLTVVLCRVTHGRARRLRSASRRTTATDVTARRTASGDRDGTIPDRVQLQNPYHLYIHRTQMRSHARTHARAHACAHGHARFPTSSLRNCTDVYPCTAPTALKLATC